MPTPRALTSLLAVAYAVLLYPVLVARRLLAFVAPQFGGAWRTWVTDSVLVGGFIVPGDVRRLQRAGIGAVLHVSSELVDPERSLERAGIAYLRIPCWDGRSPKAADMDRAMGFLRAQLEAGRKVYVHCASGAGRSITVVLAYLVLEQGVDLATTLAEVKRRRPRVSLSSAQLVFLAWYVTRPGRSGLGSGSGEGEQGRSAEGL